MALGGVHALERVVGPQPEIMGDAFTHVCPVCKKKFRYGHSFEPVCTGPSESRDDHPPTVMRLLRVDKKEINPVIARLRARAPLILPAGFVPR